MSFCTLVLLSCGGSPNDLGNTLHKGNGAEPQTLDPHRAEGVPASNILRDLYESLTEVGPDGEPILAAATSYSISKDGKTYIFNLRKNAIWSNGDPVTAHDFVFGLQRSVDPKTGSKYSLILNAIKNVEAIIEGRLPVEQMGVKALDDYTLKIILNAPTPYFFDLLNHSTAYPVHKASVEQYGKDFTKPANMVTNGAYKLDEWVIQSHISLVRNKHYWNNEQTAIDKVVYHAIQESSAELKKYRAGELDWTSSVPTTQLDWVKKKLGSDLHISPYLGCYYYGLNVTKAPFKDNVKLREALSLAIDRSIIVDQIAKAGEVPAYSFVPPGVNNYVEQPLLFKYYDRSLQIKNAQKAYREAGYSIEKPLSVEIRYNTLDGHKRIALAISAMWKEILGVETTLINEEWKVYLETRKQKQKTQVFRAGWIGDYNDANTFLELLHSKHGINDSGYNNPNFDALLAKAATTVNLTERATILARAEKMMLEDYPIIPIYFYVSKHLVKPRVEGFKPNIVDRFYTKNLRLKITDNK
tara:strand:+ start:4305 stop:5885 length:1581 start_codon:yes stop_codon:yes gene_type:complete